MSYRDNRVVLPTSYNTDIVANAVASEPTESRQASVFTSASQATIPSAATTPAEPLSALTAIPDNDTVGEETIPPTAAEPIKPYVIRPPGDKKYFPEGLCDGWSPFSGVLCATARKILDNIEACKNYDRQRKRRVGPAVPKPHDKVFATFTRPETKELCCNLCPPMVSEQEDNMTYKTFKDYHELERHVSTHLCHTHKPYRCSVMNCGHKGVQLSNMETHLRVHTKEKIRCNEVTKDVQGVYNQCPWEGNDPAALSRHRKQHHADRYTSLDVPAAEQASSVVAPGREYQFSLAAPSPEPTSAFGQSGWLSTYEFSFTWPSIKPAKKAPIDFGSVLSLDDYLAMHSNERKAIYNDQVDPVPCSFAPTARSLYFHGRGEEDNHSDSSSDNSDCCFFAPTEPARFISQFPCENVDYSDYLVTPNFVWQPACTPDYYGSYLNATN